MIYDTPIAAHSESPAPWVNKEASRRAAAANAARNASGRRRLVDPTTCEREYTERELEFMQAMQEYKRSSGRMFPTWTEVLEVLGGLGYRRITDAGAPR
jgi:hypothetical protein